MHLKFFMVTSRVCEHRNPAVFLLLVVLCNDLSNLAGNLGQEEVHDYLRAPTKAPILELRNSIQNALPLWPEGCLIGIALDCVDKVDLRLVEYVEDCISLI
jgi:hypothetical protein